MWYDRHIPIEHAEVYLDTLGFWFAKWNPIQRGTRFQLGHFLLPPVQCLDKEHAIARNCLSAMRCSYNPLTVQNG
ncbi:hypothetical protein X777_04859, partial [Ooceraea biroi]